MSAAHQRWLTAVRARVIASSTRSAVGSGSSSTIRPSARNTTRSAYAAATRVVGDHDDGLAETRRPRRAEQGEHLGADAGVEVAGRLVGEDQVGPGDQRPGDGHPLLLAAGELARPVREPVAEPDACRPPGRATPRSGLRPPRVSGSAMFSAAVSVGTRLNAWKTKPIRSRRSRVSALSFEPAEVGVADAAPAPR